MTKYYGDMNKARGNMMIMIVYKGRQGYRMWRLRIAHTLLFFNVGRTQILSEKLIDHSLKYVQLLRSHTCLCLYSLLGPT